MIMLMMGVRKMGVVMFYRLMAMSVTVFDP